VIGVWGIYHFHVVAMLPPRKSVLSLCFPSHARVVRACDHSTAAAGRGSQVETLEKTKA
jgi:hypothetical protein